MIKVTSKQKTNCVAINFFKLVFDLLADAIDKFMIKIFRWMSQDILNKSGNWK